MVNETEYKKGKQQIRRVYNHDKPRKQHAPFYSYFSEFSQKMGIPSRDLNAQSLISAMAPMRNI